MKPPPPLPMRRAKAIAEAIKADPVSAAQVKEHLPDRDLMDLLCLTSPEDTGRSSEESSGSLDDYEEGEMISYLENRGYSVV